MKDALNGPGLLAPELAEPYFFMKDALNGPGLLAPELDARRGSWPCAAGFFMLAR